MKLCINCKHINAGINGKTDEHSRCGYNHPTSLVTGLKIGIEVLPYAELERKVTGRCGMSAKNWEAADHVMTPEEEELMLKEAKYV